MMSVAVLDGRRCRAVVTIWSVLVIRGERNWWAAAPLPEVDGEPVGASSGTMPR